MSSDIPEEVLELSYDELQSRLTYYLQEWKAQRNAAFRIFTASLLILSVSAALISVIPDETLQQVNAQPITSIWDVIGPIAVALGIMALFVSMMSSIYALQSLPDSVVQNFWSTIPDAVASEFTEVSVRTSDSVVHPRQSSEEWHRAVVAEYAHILSEVQNDSISLSASRWIRVSYNAILIGVFLIVNGIAISLVL